MTLGTLLSPPKKVPVILHPQVKEADDAEIPLPIRMPSIAGDHSGRPTDGNARAAGAPENHCRDSAERLPDRAVSRIQGNVPPTSPGGAAAPQTSGPDPASPRSSPRLYPVGNRTCRAPRLRAVRRYVPDHGLPPPTNGGCWPVTCSPNPIGNRAPIVGLLTGSREAATRAPFPQNVACGFHAPRSSAVEFTALPMPAAPDTGGAVSVAATVSVV